MRLFRVLLVAALFGTGPTASAQIVWNPVYLDTTSGFFDAGIDAGETLSRGQLRRNSVTAATNYLGTVLDGRGTVNLQFNVSQNDGSGFLASYGPQQLTGLAGTFQNGGVYQSARSNQRPFTGNDGSGTFDFGFGWNYAGQNNAPNAGRFDLATVALHEIGHGLGFLSNTSPNGSGLLGGAPGTPNLYAGYDRFLQRGNGPLATSALFNTNIASSGYGSFTGLASTFTNGTNATTGLFFGGEFAREVFGGPAPLFAPAGYQPGSSVSHVDNAAAVMNPSVTPNTVKRFLPYEIAMLMDIGWNLYNWNGTTGNWQDGVSNIAQSRWRTNSGIVFNGAANGNQTFNTFANPGQAPVLPVYGQVTANIVLNFGGSGAGYTTTNDIGTVRMSRLNLNSTATSVTITGGTLNFGQNSDGSASVLAPKIVQQNSGAFVIASTVQTNNVATQVVGGVSFPGSAGLTIDGPGAGQVSLTGPVTGTGSLTKAGSFTLVLSNNSNAYAGGTTVNAGTLRVTNTTGSATGTGAVIVNNAATLNGTGIITGAVTVNNTGTLAPGDTTAAGQLQTGGITFSATATLDADLNGVTAGTLYDQLVVTGTVNLNGALLNPSLGYTPAAADKLFILVNDGSDVVTGTFGGLPNGASFALGASTAFIYYDADSLGGNLFGGNDIVISFSPVPEPAAVLGLTAFLGLGAAGLRRMRRVA